MSTPSARKQAKAASRATDFSAVTYEQAIERARALVPALRERASRAEDARSLLPESEADLHASGLLRCSQPKRWGGMELDYVALFDIPAELARGCASTAWSCANLAIHHWMLALYDERAQAEVWGENPDALIASGIAYPQGGARRAEGGFVIEGHWNFSSGVDGSQWNMLAVTVRDGQQVIDHRMCLVPRSDFEVVDDWHVLGMRGTGSKSVRVKDLFVPEHRALCMYLARGGADFPGARSNPHPHYRIPLSGVGSHCVAGAAVGNAQAALELSTVAVSDRTTNYAAARMREFQAVQLRVAAAGARIDAARLIVRKDLFEAQGIAEAGRAPTLEEKLRAKRNVAYAVQLCTEAVDSLHGMAGARGIYDHYPIQRLFRDAHSLMGHIAFSWDAQAAPWGLVALGGDYQAPATL
ncbi:MAG: acyl-CoA dehydrogenase family protein [Proteobacteria bacterium]|nr:acyl-CoA dehydrogenase family protein [Pseudomonadota bacterium]MDA1118038.1 acyl-CoA dehydrogenase family protein [Pseudomonadota bacterium]